MASTNFFEMGTKTVSSTIRVKLLESHIKGYFFGFHAPQNKNGDFIVFCRATPYTITPYRETPFCTVEGTNLKWKVYFLPAGDQLKINMIFSESYYKQRDTEVTIENTGIKHRIKYHDSIHLSLNDLRKACYTQGGSVVIKVTTSFEVPYCDELPLFSVKAVSRHAHQLSFHHERFDGITPDFKFHFYDGKCVMAHKDYLSEVSPVFKAMLAHDTKEAQSGILEVKDFDHEVVKVATDLLYGRPFEPKPIDQVVGILRFVEKYLITSAVDLLEDWLLKNINETNFDSVVQYAFDHDSKKLKAICGHCYYKHLKPGLRNIDPAIISELVHMAANESER